MGVLLLKYFGTNCPFALDFWNALVYNVDNPDTQKGPYTMKTKPTFRMLLAAILVMATLLSQLAIVASADESNTIEPPAKVSHPYVENGLVTLYSGTLNSRDGHDTAATVWEDLVGENDFTINVDDKNYFTADGLRANGVKHNLPTPIVDVVNGDAFTVELLFGEFESLGTTFNTFLNSSNDKFALFRRNATNQIEFKFSGNAGDLRHKIDDGLNLLQNALISVTYEVGGNCYIYVNGELMAEKPSPSVMGADDLYIGHDDPTKTFDTTFKSIRFYDRALSEEEIIANAMADGKISISDRYVNDGLVTLYSGLYHGTDSAVWEDLVGENDFTVNIDENNYFTADGLRAEGVKHNLPTPIVDVVNGNAFTVELLFGEFESLGTTFNTFLNSSNDKFALFRRVGPDQIEFKFAGNAADQRHKIDNGLDLLQNALISVTYEVGGNCCIYVNGELMAEKPSPSVMGADDLYISHDDPTKTFDTTFKSIRFYNRALTEKEILANAKADNAVSEGPAVVIPAFVSVAQPQTNIIGDIALIRQINTADELTQLAAAEKKPAIALYTIDESLNILSDKGATISTVADVLIATEFKMLSAFQVKSQAAADALVAYLKEIKFYDCLVVTADPAIMKATRTALPSITGVIDYTETYKDATELTEAQCLDIRRSIKTNNGTIALLPAAVCSNATVQYLYDRQVNVWARAADAPSQKAQYAALLSGAIGVVSDATDSLLDIACNKLPASTMTRVPLNVGHRGIPSKAPENTLEGSILAFEEGANVIELDVYITTDGEVVVMHDGNTGRTCNLALDVESSTWTQLSELFVNKNYENHTTFSQCRIPTLKNYLEYFKGKDCNLFIEIKSNKAAIVPAIKKLVDEYDMYSQCSVITFNEPIMAAMRKDYPEMSVGALCGGFMAGSNPEADLRAAMNFIGKYNATLNPSSGGYDKADLRAALLRGISIYPWTFRGTIDVYKDYFLWGYSGLTGDNANELNRLTNSVVWTPESTTVTVGDTLPLSLQVITFGRQEANRNADVLILDGEGLVGKTADGLQFTGDGQVTLMLAYTHRIAGSARYVLHTAPVTFTVTKKAEETTPAPVETTETPMETTATPAEGTTPAPTEDTDPAGTPDPKPSGCASAVSSIALLALTTGAAALVLTRKRRED